MFPNPSGEYLNGKTEANSQRLKEIIRMFTILDHTARAADFGAAAQRNRMAAGRMISLENALIAGTLLAPDVERIITRDARGFEGIEGIEVIEY